MMRKEDLSEAGDFRDLRNFSERSDLSKGGENHDNHKQQITITEQRLTINN